MFFGLKNCGKIVNVLKRQSYNDLCKLIMDSTSSVIGLTGNPGTGKTFFGFFLLLHAVNAGKSVLYHRQTPYFVSKNKTCAASHQKTDLYILDALTNEQLTSIDIRSTKYIYIYTPSARNKSWELGNGEIYHMPIWSRVELDELASKLNFEQSIDDNYDYFGGIPRYVFSTPHGVQSQLERMDEVIANSELVNTLTSKTEMQFSHLIFHRITTAPNYTKYELRVATDYVKKIFFDFTTETGMRNSVKFLSHSSGLPLLSTLRGDIYEDLAHDTICKGGTFDRITYSTISYDDITFRKMEQRKFHRSDGINIELLYTYYIPHSATYRTVDSIHSGNVFQMTVKRKRELTVNEVRILKDTLKVQKLDFYFVVPNDIFNKFTITKFNELWKSKEWITFYIIKVDPQ